MGFWNALSVLAPVAPALSDAQDIRAQRAQDAQDLELKRAQATIQGLAAEEARQRIRAGTQPLFKQGSQPEFNPAAGTYQQPAWNPDKGAYALVDVPGESPEQLERQQLDSLKKNRAAAKEMMPPDTRPEDLDYIAYTLSGMKPPVSKITQLTGDAGKPYKGADGQWYVNEKDETGGIIAKSMGANYQPPPPKPTSPSAQYANLLSKQILANRKQGPPLTNEEAAQLQGAQGALTLPGIARMKALAEFAAQTHLQVVTGDDGQDILIPVAQAVTAANAGQPYGGPGIGSATGMDKKNALLARSAIQQVNRMEAILKADPNLTGPGSGQLTRLQMWLGTQDPDAQQFLISSLMGSEHGVAVFGGRNIHTIQDLNNALGSMKTNPAALTGALEVIRETMQPWVTADGRLVNPRAAGGGTGGAGGGTTKQHSLRAAMALPFNKGKTAAQVKADLEAHGYTVVP